MAVSPLIYLGFIGFVIAMLLVDLRFFETGDEAPSAKKSGTWVGIWVSLGLLFGAILWFWQGSNTAVEYFTGYVIEYSLSVDNMFVFVLIFSYFQIPFAYQHRVLFFGILGALIFRGLFIAIGTALISTFDFILYVFGGFLILTAIRIARGTDDVDPERNPVLKFAQKRFPTTTKFDGQNLFIKENGQRVATPLFVALLFIETTDIMFAVDSIPAIFGITQNPFIVLTSNVFALIGLRALYFLVAGGIERLHLLHYGLAIVLAFVGAKMLLEIWHIEIPVFISLGVIVAVIGTTAVLSLKIPAPEGKQQEVGFPAPDEVEQKEHKDGDEAA